MNLLKRIEAALLAGQHGHPTGLVGRLVGEQMVCQHVTETIWTLSLLDLKPEDQVLEVGFGAGRAIELAAKHTVHGQIVGIDRSDTMVRAATHRNAKAIKAGRVTLHHGDGGALPFAAKQFDTIFSIQTLYFWSDLPRAFAEIFRVLKPGGRLVVTLSTGTIDTTQATGLERYQGILEEQVLPCMQQLGFTQAVIKQGPASRQFQTTALIGVK